MLGNQTLFYVNPTTSYGHFSLVSQPQVWINTFTQGQLNSSQVQFVHDGSLNVPSYSSMVQAFGLFSASLPMRIFFQPGNRPPLLVRTLLDQTITVGQPFSDDLSNCFADPDGNPVTLLVNPFNSSRPLPAWLTFDAGSNRLLGTPKTPGVLTLNATAQDPSGLTASTDFALSIIITSSNESSSTYSTVEKAIIGAVVSGTIGIFFAIAQGCLKRAANKKLADALGESKEAYEEDVLQPVAREIARHIKITGFMNYTTNTDMAQFKSAVRIILSQLAKQGVDLNFKEMNPAIRGGMISTIAGETRRIVLGKKGCCSSLFKPRVTPQELIDAAPKIALAVVNQFKRSETVTPSQAPLEMKLSSSQHRLSLAIKVPAHYHLPPSRGASVKCRRQYSLFALKTYNISFLHSNTV